MKNGYTLIDLMTAIAFLLIVVGVVLMAISNYSSNGGITWGINGTVESRCVDGFRYTVDSHGTARQILDVQGHGIPCK